MLSIKIHRVFGISKKKNTHKNACRIEIQKKTKSKTNSTGSQQEFGIITSLYKKIQFKLRGKRETKIMTENEKEKNLSPFMII